MPFKTLRESCAQKPTYRSFVEFVFTKRKLLVDHYSEPKNKKVERVKREFFAAHKIEHNEKLFKNLTDTVFPFEFQWLLGLGPKFALPVERSQFPLFKFIADIEHCIRTVGTVDAEKAKQIAHERDIIRAKVANLLTNLKNNLRLSPLEKVILKIHSECVNFMK